MIQKIKVINIVPYLPIMDTWLYNLSVKVMLCVLWLILIAEGTVQCLIYTTNTNGTLWTHLLTRRSVRFCLGFHHFDSYRFLLSHLTELVMEALNTTSTTCELSLISEITKYAINFEKKKSIILSVTCLMVSRMIATKI